jgi:acyl-CoA synthetase (AMP-forming)/AMP-acid ligase II
MVPGVGMSAVIGVPDKVLGEVVWAVVQPIPGMALTAENVMEKCKSELASFKVPKRIIFRDELPLTRIGKVHRVEIQKEIVEAVKAGSV